MSNRWRFVVFDQGDAQRRAKDVDRMIDAMTLLSADPFICRSPEGPLLLTVSMGPSEIGVLYLEGSGGSDDGIPY